MAYIDLNADIGEGSPLDADLMRLVTSVNVACGGHAGDVDTMAQAMQSAQTLGLRVGAHPSYPDRDGFGRTSSVMSVDAIVQAVSSQIDVLASVANRIGVEVAYIKLHGALYNDAAWDEELASAMVRLFAGRKMPVMALADSIMVEAARSEGAAVVEEGFIDRRYASDGSLVSRQEPGAVISDPAEAAAQALVLAPSVDSLCVHSDSPDPVGCLTACRLALESEGYRIGPE